MRELLIVKLQKRINTLTSVLIKEYDAKLLVKLEEAEKDLQIQQAYLSQEK